MFLSYHIVDWFIRGLACRSIPHGPIVNTLNAPKDFQDLIFHQILWHLLSPIPMLGLIGSNMFTNICPFASFKRSRSKYFAIPIHHDLDPINNNMLSDICHTPCKRARAVIRIDRSIDRCHSY